MYSEPHDQLAPPVQRSFRVCARCGQPTPSQLPQCVNCGAISIQEVSPEPESNERERAHRRFAVAFFSRSASVSYVLIAVNVILFLMMAWFPNGTDDSAVIIAFGAKTNDLLKQGDWYRLVTPIFLHGGFLHLFSNSYALWSVGPQVERLYGSARFLLIYLVAGIGGVIGSFIGQELMHKPSTPSVGASGAIFGLFGVLAVFGYKYRHELPPEFRKAFGSGVFPVIAINLFIGLTIPFIDNGAHVGGLLTGAVLALAIPYVAPGSERVSRIGLALLALCLSVVGYSFARAYRDSGTHLSWGRAVVAEYLAAVNQAQESIDSAFKVLEDSGNEKARNSMRKPLAEIIGRIEKTTAMDAGADRIRLGLLGVLRKQDSLMVSPSRDPERSAVEDYEQVRSQLNEWVRQEGAKHGLSMGESKEQTGK